jgi:beta-glucosidase
VDKATQQWDDKAFLEFLGQDGIGCMQHPDKDNEHNPAICNHIQKLVKENTRLGIPVLFVTETLHGHTSADATIFPQCIGLASAFNKELQAKIGRVIGKEAGLAGAKLTCGPNLDLAQDPRWGRTEETYGEDPYLTSEMGRLYVTGLQGLDENIGEDCVGCAPKHYLAHGAPQGGLNLSPVPCGMRHMREYFLPPFEKVIRKCRPLGIMPAYSEMDGVPLHQSKFALTDLLRTELGFDGLVISDYEGIEFLKRYHETADTFEEAGMLALKAGVDVEANRIVCYNEKLIQMTKEGKFPIAYVVSAVRRVLYVKFRAGLLTARG